MKIKILFFASCRDVTGTPSIEIDISNENYSEESVKDQSRLQDETETADSKQNQLTVFDILKKYVFLVYPSLAPPSEDRSTNAYRYSIALNRKYVKGDEIVRDGDEIALLPPISGG